jgi:hypothetical protein
MDIHTESDIILKTGICFDECGNFYFNFENENNSFYKQLKLDNNIQYDLFQVCVDNKNAPYCENGNYEIIIKNNIENDIITDIIQNDIKDILSPSNTNLNTNDHLEYVEEMDKLDKINAIESNKHFINNKIENELNKDETLSDIEKQKIKEEFEKNRELEILKEKELHEQEYYKLFPEDKQFREIEPVFNPNMDDSDSDDEEQCIFSFNAQSKIKININNRNNGEVFSLYETIIYDGDFDNSLIILKSSLLNINALYRLLIYLNGYCSFRPIGYSEHKYKIMLNNNCEIIFKLI